MGTQLPLSKRGQSPQFSAHVYCGQTAGWIKMSLGTEVGLGPGHIVQDGDPAPPPPKGAQPAIFGPYLLWPTGWMDQYPKWYGGWPRLRRHYARWEPSSPTKRGQSPQFSAHVCCGQSSGWIKMPLGTKIGLGPGHIVLHGDPAPPSQKWHSPQFFAHIFYGHTVAHLSCC